MTDIAGQLRSLWTQLEDALGVTISRVSYWIAPSIAALWFWTGDGWGRLPQNAVFPSESPMAWAQRMLAAGGFDAVWPTQLARWMDQRNSLEPVWLVAAVVLASYAVACRENRELVNLSVVCLLAAMQVGEPERAWTWLIGGTSAICVGCLAWNNRSRAVRNAVGSGRTTATVAITKWAAGPGWVAFGMIIIPFLLIGRAFTAYRYESVTPISVPSGAAVVKLDSHVSSRLPVRAFHIPEPGTTNNSASTS